MRSVSAIAAAPRFGSPSASSHRLSVGERSMRDAIAGPHGGVVGTALAPFRSPSAIRYARLSFGRPGRPGLTPLIPGAIGFTPYLSRPPWRRDQLDSESVSDGFGGRCSRGWIDSAPRGSAAG